MRKTITLVTLALLAFLTGCASLGTDEKQHVVYHINFNDEAQLKAALGNVQNHINAIGKDKIDLKIVLHGKGVDLLMVAQNNLDMQEKIIKLKNQDVTFQVCKNTLTGRKINYKTDLFDVSEKDLVPSGVAQLAILQQQGYVYIKP